MAALLVHIQYHLWMNHTFWRALCRVNPFWGKGELCTLFSHYMTNIGFFKKIHLIDEF